jgi:hypothetical protein
MTSQRLKKTMKKLKAGDVRRRTESYTSLKAEESRNTAELPKPRRKLTVNVMQLKQWLIMPG